MPTKHNHKQTRNPKPYKNPTLTWKLYLTAMKRRGSLATPIGHGVGMKIWEKPIISRMFSLDHPYEIREGMTFALETWCPVEDGEGAARIEEEVVVAKDGCERLFKYPPEELISCGLLGTVVY